MKTISSLAIATFLMTTPLLAQTHICQKVVDSELSRVGVSPDAIASTRIERDYGSSGGESGPEFTGYTYWMKMKACSKGYLLVTMHTTCQPIGDPATVYGCQVSGVKQC